MGSLGGDGSLLAAGLDLANESDIIASQVSSLLTPSAPCCPWLDLHMLPLHAWRCTAITCQLMCGSWWAGGAFSLTSSTAGKEHRSVERGGDAVRSAQGKQDLAGPLLQGTLLCGMEPQPMLFPLPHQSQLHKRPLHYLMH